MCKIIVVDDDAAIRMLYYDELSEEGYDVVACDDGCCLMDFIEKSKPDLILMEARLSKCDGLDLLQQIRDTYLTLPVILCTAYPAFKYDMRSVLADEYIIKSGNLRELKSKIRKVLEGRKPSIHTGMNSVFHGKGMVSKIQEYFEWKNH